MRIITSIVVSAALGFAGIVGVASTAQAAPSASKTIVKPSVDVNCYHYIYILGQKRCVYS